MQAEKNYENLPLKLMQQNYELTEKFQLKLAPIETIKKFSLKYLR